jgi:argininosuccinate lyase
MAHHDLLIQVKVVSDQEARHVQKALQTIANNFKAQELVSISKKIELPLVKLKIKSMI